MYIRKKGPKPLQSQVLETRLGVLKLSHTILKVRYVGGLRQIARLIQDLSRHRQVVPCFGKDSLKHLLCPLLVASSPKPELRRCRSSLASCSRE